MKCSSCKIDISPGYTKALNENTCPACGEEIMTEPLFQEFGSIKEALSDSAVVEADLVKVASLIAGKYRLVPKGTAGTPGPGQRFEHRPVTRAGESAVVEEERDADLAGLPLEAQIREKALRDAEEEKTAMDWGLDKGELATSSAIARDKTSDITQEPLSNEVIELASMIGGGDAGVGDLPMAPTTDPFEAQRMAKLASLKADSTYRSVRRAEG